MSRPGFAATKVLADPPAMDVLHRLTGTLRAAGYQNRVLPGESTGTASLLALGHPAPVTAVPDRDVRALVSTGAVDVHGGHLTPRFTLFASGEALILIPADGHDDPERVYFGRDSLWLAEMATRFPGGGTLADLGTGAGTVATLLAPRFEQVVATDVAARTAACAAITFALNRRPDGAPAAAACLADVAAGLQPATFSLVTANPPWMPALDRDVHGPRRIFAEGGETGFELPRRFVVEGAALLAPDGILVMLALDAIWQDGARPLHAIGRGLRRLGYEVTIVPTGVDEPWRHSPIDPATRFPGIRSADHVALIVHRPPAAAPGPQSAVVAHGTPEEGPEEAVGAQLLDHATGR